MTRPRKRRGLLTDLATGSLSKKKKKRPASKTRRVLTWVVGGAVTVGALIVIGIFATVSFDPTLGATEGEADVTVEELRESPRGFAADVVAAAGVTLEGRRVFVPLADGERDGVLVGAELHVRYTFFPRTGSVRVDHWELKP